MTTSFADYLTTTAIAHQSVLCAGIDPVLNTFPKIFVDAASHGTTQDESFYENVLYSFYEFCLLRISKQIACIKPNIAFFEQYGIGGLKALQRILHLAAQLRLPSIVDCKRGDIGSTAQAYINAYLPKTAPFACDAITVNAFLGFDTAQTFLDGAVHSGKKGLFFLVKTSNPGSSDLQDLQCEGKTISERIAAWIEKNASHLAGNSYNVSGLGAVVGATHPEHLTALRKAMPHALFLIPGYGAQGGKAEDLKSAFTGPFTGAVVNASRGLFNSFSSQDLTYDQLEAELLAKVSQMNSDLRKVAA